MVRPGALGCETARSRRVAVNGLDLHLLEWGTPGRPPLCLLHGGGAHAHWFDAVAPAFADRFHVVALDQRGHGESAWARPPAYATEDFAADLVGLMDRLGWERMTLVGHSMGGHNAIAFAAWHPERLRSLVIADTRPAIPAERLEHMHERGRRSPRHHGTIEAAVQSFHLLPPDTVADHGLLAHLARVGFARKEGWWTLRYDPAGYASRKPVDAWPLLPRITAPTLIVRGELSPVLPADLAERMRHAIAGASLVEIAGAYHHLMLDHPVAFAAGLDEFLRHEDRG